MGVFQNLIAILLFCSISVSGQIDCSITADPDRIICSPQDLTLSAYGNINSLQWTDANGKIISTNSSINVNVTENTFYKVTNKVTFGPELIINGNFESGNTAFTSDYFESCIAGTMPQGAYCINDNSDYYHPGWSACTDKSGSGKYLICDGAVIAGEAIWCQTVNVQQNKDYAFSTWINAIFPTAPPIMQFSINGNLLGQPFESTNSTCVWQEFFEIWNSGLNTTANICILNQNTAGEGNDFGIDNISLKEACYSEATVRISLQDSIKVDLGPDTTFCKGDDYTLRNLASNGNPNLKYQWSTGESSSSITVQNPSTYILRLYSDEGCEGKDTVSFQDIGLPINTLPADTNICFIAYPDATLKSGKALNTLWLIGEQQDTSTAVSIQQEGNYTVILSNGENCITRHTIYVKSDCSNNLFLPNAFSPNGDGLNDLFGPETIETYGYDLTIYNRWGQVVFKTTNSKEKWDGRINGKRAETGLYVYYLEYKVVDYYQPILKFKRQSGTVTLVR